MKIAEIYQKAELNMNKKITTLEHELEEQIKALEKYRNVLPKDSRLIGQIDELVKKAKYIDKKALKRFGGEVLKHTSHLIDEIRKIKKEENIKAEDSREMWLNVTEESAQQNTKEEAFLNLLPEDDKEYWLSASREERGVILDAMKESAKIDKPFRYPKKLGEKLRDILGVKRVLNKIRPSDSRIPKEFEVPGSVSNEEEKGIKNGKEIKIPSYSPIKEGDVWEEEKGPLSQYSNKGVFDKELKDGLSHELRHQKELIPKIVDFNNKYSKYDDMILSKKEEKEIQNEADKDNEKFLTKDEPFAYFKSWYDRMSEKTIKSVLSGISIDSCNYFEDMLNLNNKLKKNGFSKQQAAQIILSFDSSNIDEIGVLLHNEEDFNEFVRFAKTEPDKREVASKYLAVKYIGDKFKGRKLRKEADGRIWNKAKDYEVVTVEKHRHHYVYHMLNKIDKRIHGKAIVILRDNKAKIEWFEVFKKEEELGTIFYKKLENKLISEFSVREVEIRASGSAKFWEKQEFESPIKGQEDMRKILKKNNNRIKKFLTDDTASAGGLFDGEKQDEFEKNNEKKLFYSGGEKSMDGFFKRMENKLNLVKAIGEHGLNYLFCIEDKEFIDELKKITPAVRGILSEKMISVLTKNNIISIDGGQSWIYGIKPNRWHLWDMDKSIIYVLLKKEGKINVYLSSDYESKKFKHIIDGDEHNIRREKIGYRCLFSLDLTYKKYLKEGEIREKLKKAFEDKNIFFKKAIVSKMEEDWIIKDEGRMYSIKEEEGRLNIYDSLNYTQLSSGTSGKLLRVSTEGDKIAVKIPRLGRSIEEKEYKLLERAYQIIPKNVPEPLGYNEETQKLMMEPISGDSLPFILKYHKSMFAKKPKLISELGRIIAVMHNENFIHGDLASRNILLNEKEIWKIVDFADAIDFGKFENDKTWVISLLKCQEKDFEEIFTSVHFKKSESFRVFFLNLFSQSYLINRNFKKIAHFLIRNKYVSVLHSLTEYVFYLTENIKEPSQEVNKCLGELISQIETDVKKYNISNRISILLYLKEKLEKNPNIDITLQTQPIDAIMEIPIAEELIEENQRLLENLK